MTQKSFNAASHLPSSAYFFFLFLSFLFFISFFQNSHIQTTPLPSPTDQSVSAFFFPKASFPKASDRALRSPPQSSALPSAAAAMCEFSSTGHCTSLAPSHKSAAEMLIHMLPTRERRDHFRRGSPRLAKPGVHGHVFISK